VTGCALSQQKVLGVTFICFDFLLCVHSLGRILYENLVCVGYYRQSVVIIDTDSRAHIKGSILGPAAGVPKTQDFVGQFHAFKQPSNLRCVSSV